MIHGKTVAKPTGMERVRRHRQEVEESSSGLGASTVRAWAAAACAVCAACGSGGGATLTGSGAFPVNGVSSYAQGFVVLQLWQFGDSVDACGAEYLTFPPPVIDSITISLVPADGEVVQPGTFRIGNPYDAGAQAAPGTAWFVLSGEVTVSGTVTLTQTVVDGGGAYVGSLSTTAPDGGTLSGTFDVPPCPGSSS